MVERWRRAPAVKWFKEVKALCEASGHWAIAQQMIGKALMCRPDGMGIWDPWFVAHEGQVHLFHLQKRAGSNRTDAEADHIGHATSRDLIRWTEQPLTIGPGEKGGMEDLQPWTGGAVVKDGVFHLYYTMRSSRDDARNQHIVLATSRDLVNWQRHPGNPVIAPDPRWYGHEGKPEPDNKVGCRDLKVVRDPAGNGWMGFYAATVPAEEEAEAACIALARSQDLIHWEQLPPAFAPKRYGEVEAHDVFPLGGKWWMTCLTSHGHGNRGIFADPTSCAAPSSPSRTSPKVPTASRCQAMRNCGGWGALTVRFSTSSWCRNARFSMAR